MNAKILAIAILLGLSPTLHAHSGGLDARGCHNSKKIGFHCHASRSGGVSGSGESSKDRDSRLKRECKGAVNAGACAGYTR
jgi:hypothetical protein